MNKNEQGVYEHEAFTALHQRKGSGLYRFSERLGMGGYFWLASTGAVPYNSEPLRHEPGSSYESSASRLYDIYDVLRAVESGKVWKMEQEEGHKIPLLTAFDFTQPPLGMVVVHNDGQLDQMAANYIDGIGFDLGARLEKCEPKRGSRLNSKITAFSIIPRALMPRRP